MRRTGRCGCCRGSARPPVSRAAGNASAADARARSWPSRSPRASSTFLDVDQSMKQGIMVRCTAPIRSMCRMIWASFGSSPGLRSRTAATVPATVPAVGQRLARPCEGERRDQSHLDAGFKRTVCEGSMVVPRSPRIRRPQDHRSGRAHRQTGHGPPLRSEPSFFIFRQERRVGAQVTSTRRFLSNRLFRRAGSPVEKVFARASHRQRGRHPSSCRSAAREPDAARRGDPGSRSSRIDTPARRDRYRAALRRVHRPYCGRN